MDPRDERFVEGAVAAGALDASAAARLLEARRVAPSSEPIEDYAVRTRVLTREAIERTIAYVQARAGLPPRPPSSGSDDLFLDSDLGPGQIIKLPAVGPASPRTTAASPNPGAALTPNRSGLQRTLRAIPDRFGPYEVKSEIARGGMGVVYRATGPHVGGAPVREVALKVLLDSSDPTEDQVRRFEREIKTGLVLDHPNVVRVFEGGKIDGKLYFTMELVSGTSLDKLLPKAPLRDKVAILEKVARAVHHAHEKGYIHRDLKPHNILVTEANEPKVADFGLARSIDRHSRLTKTGALVGTPYYMSPEQARGEHDACDARTDVYSLGAILYEALSNRLPFQADTALALIGQILSDDPPDPTTLAPDCPPELAAVALKALEKEPDARFQTAALLADELDRWLGGRRTSTVREGSLGKILKRARRARSTLLLLGAIAGVALLPTAFIGWKILTSRREARLAASSARELELRRQIDAAARMAERLLAPAAVARALADDPQPYRDALAELERLVRAPDDSGYDELARPLREALAAAGIEEKRAAIEAALLVADAPTIRDAELAKLRERVVRALERAPDRDDLELALATVDGRLGATERAAAALVHVKSPAALERAAELALELGDPRGAAADYKKALEAEPQRRSARLGLARALFVAGDPAALGTLGDERGRDARILAAEATWLKDRALGLELLRAAEREQTNDPEVVRRLGELLLRSERADEARLQLSKAAELAPKDPRPLLARAEARLLEGDAAKALDDLVAAADLARPGSLVRARARGREAEVRAWLGDAKAASVLEAARAERPDDLELALLAHVVLGREQDLARIATSLGARAAAARAWSLVALEAAATDARRATEAARSALAVAPDDPRALAVLGRLGDGAARRTAHLAFRRWAGDEGRFLRASIVRDRLHARFQHEDDKAAAELLLALAEKNAPWAAAPRLERARRLARAESGREAAVELLEAGVEACGGDEDGDALLALLSLEQAGKGDAGRARVARAEELASRALSFAPKHAAALSARGRARLILGRSEEALADLDASLALDRRVAATWEAKAAALDALGRADDAAKARKEAEERGARCKEIAYALWKEGDGLTLNGTPRYREGIPKYRRALDLDPTLALASARLGTHLLIGFEEFPDEPIYRLAQGAFWDPAVSMPDGDTVRALQVASDVVALATRLEKDAATTSKLEDLWTATYCRELSIESGSESREAIALARLDLERVIDADPTTISAFLYRGFLRALERQTDLAAQDEEKALRYFPASAFAYLALAIGEARDGHRKDARDALKKAIEREATIVEKARHRSELAPLLPELGK